MTKFIPVALFLMAVMLALPDGRLNTALVVVNAFIGIGYSVFGILEYKKGK